MTILIKANSGIRKKDVMALARVSSQYFPVLVL